MLLIRIDQAIDYRHQSTLPCLPVLVHQNTPVSRIFQADLRILVIIL